MTGVILEVDGNLVEFPDVETAQAYMQSRSPSKAAPDPQDATPSGRADMSFWGRVKDNVMGVDDGVLSTGEKIATALNMGGEGMTMGLVGDEAAAFTDSLVGRGGYEERLARHRGNERQFSDENPVAAMASTVVPSLLVPGGAVVKGAGLLGKAGMGAVAGGAGAGTFGFMEGEGGFDERRRSAVNSAILGAGLGAAAPVAGAGAARVIDRVRAGRAIKQAAKNAPTREQLEVRAGQIFDDLKGQGLSRGPFKKTVASAIDEATDAGMDSMLTPQAARVAQKMDEVAQNPNPTLSMRDLNTLRRQASVPAGDVANKVEGALGTRFIKAIDDHVDNVAPQLGQQGKEARAMWAKLRKMDQMDEIFARAEQYASGFQNGLMSEFRKILKSKKLQRGYSKAELEAMKRVTNPGLLQGLIRQAGRLGFSLDNGSNALGGALGAGAGSMLGGPVGAMLAPLAGTAARKASERMTVNAANRVADVVRAGNANVPRLTNQSRGLLDEMLLRSGRTIPMLQSQ